MDIGTENRKVNSFFKYMKNWDNKSKKDLIIKLTESIDTETKCKSDFSSSFGAWIDNRTADEIIDDIYSSRVNNRDVEEF
jgi:hypothetical protein